MIYYFLNTFCYMDVETWGTCIHSRTKSLYNLLVELGFTLYIQFLCKDICFLITTVIKISKICIWRFSQIMSIWSKILGCMLLSTHLSVVFGESGLWFQAILQIFIPSPFPVLMTTSLLHTTSSIPYLRDVSLEGSYFYHIFPACSFFVPQLIQLRISLII